MSTKSFLGILFLALAAAGTISCAPNAASNMIAVTSPDGKNVITARFPSGPDAAPTFAVSRSGREVIGASAFKIVLAEEGDVASGAKLVESREEHVDRMFGMPWSAVRMARDQYTGAHIRFESRGGISWVLEVRAYDDGVAFRYTFPEQPKLQRVVLEREATEFRLVGAPTLLLTTTDSLAWSHERLYNRSPLALVPAGPFIELPALAEWPDGTAAVFTEAALRDFAGLYLERVPDSEGPVLRTVLSPRLDRPDAAVLGATPCRSPWRVVELADEAGRLVESRLLLCLNDPPAGDFSWLRTGKTTWHWWNGTAEEGLPGKTPFTSFDYHREYIDFCARHGIAYHAVVADNRPWYKQSLEDFAPGPDTDITEPRAGLDLQRIVAYGRDKGVGIRLWVHWRALEPRLEEAFATYEAWGIAGLMVDFLDRDDQEMVDFNWRVLEAAARHHLHIQFHGSYHPTGEWRTFPNLFNREGALNLEYLKWGMKCDPQHDVDVAYARSLAGPTDYHLGGFSALGKSDFRARFIHPYVLGTRCHQLALYVVYENPMPQVCDAPSAYEGQPGFEFIEAVPTTWDETRFLAGRPGECIAVARRSGSTWYLAGITNDTARRISIPLGFLEPGEREATIFRDGSMDPERPNDVAVERRSVSAASSLEFDLATGGGFAAIVRAK
jgi:alpha-glucosidase